MNYPKLLNAPCTLNRIYSRSDGDGVNWTLGNRYLAKLATFTQIVTIYIFELFAPWTGENSKITMVNIQHDDGQ